MGWLLGLPLKLLSLLGGILMVLLRFARGKNWWPKLRPVCSVLLAAGIFRGKKRGED